MHTHNAQLYARVFSGDCAKLLEEARTCSVEKQMTGRAFTPNEVLRVVRALRSENSQGLSLKQGSSCLVQSVLIPPSASRGFGMVSEAILADRGGVGMWGG